MYGFFEHTFRKHRERFIKDYRMKEHWLEMNQILLSQFEYEGLPETLPAEWIEGILISNGTVGIGKINDKLYACMGGYAGNINGYLPDKYYGAVQGIGTLEGDATSPGCNEELRIGGTIGTDIVVGWNNSMLAPDMDIVDYAARLTENDTSEDLNILFTRLLRIPVVDDDKQREIVVSAIKCIMEGKIDAVASKTGLNEVISGKCNEQKFLDLVDIKEVDKLQYLNQYHDNIIKRFYQRHGHPIQVTSKLAQQTNAEIHGADTVCMIYPLQQLKYRKKMCEDLNNVFGLNVTVKFSELLQNNYDAIINYVQDEGNEKEIVKEEGVENVEAEVDTDEGNTGDITE